jgi:recombination protein RecA
MGRHPKDCNCEHCKGNSEAVNPEVEKSTNGADKDFDLLAKELERNYNAKRASEIIIEPKIRVGLYAIDYVLDGGLAQCEGGHKIELYGRESSGKTTIALKIVAKYQSLNKRIVWVNAENSYDPQWAEINGVDNSKLVVVKPETLEDAGDLVISLIPKVDLIIVDSIVALLPAEELEGKLEDKHMASQAKVNAPMCRKINQAYKNYKTTLIFINQCREKVGIMYGNPETTAGGRALKHLYDSRIEVRAGQAIEINKEKIGFEMNLKCVKNKKGKPQHQAVIDFYYTGNFDNRKSLLFAGVKYGVIKFSGKTYEYKDLKAVGKEAFMELMTDKAMRDIENDIWKVAK